MPKGCQGCARVLATRWVIRVHRATSQRRPAGSARPAFFFRAVLAQVASRHFGLSDHRLSALLPGYDGSPEDSLALRVSPRRKWTGPSGRVPDQPQIMRPHGQSPQLLQTAHNLPK